MAEEEKIEIEIEGDSPSQEPDKSAGTESPEAKPLADVAVEVKDDTPEKDKGREPRKGDPEIPDDEEIKTYSESVQKRIKKLRFEFHEERRAKEAYQRQLDEAVRLARMATDSHEQLRKKYAVGEQVLVEQAKNRNEAELARARELYKAAFNSGDADKLTEAQEVIAKLAAERRDIDTYRPHEPPALQMPQPTQQAPRPSNRAAEWAAENSWFMKDQDMTNYALVVDERLKRQGVAPDSDDYYEKLNASLAREFPDRFKNSSSQAEVSAPKKPGPVVAPTTRTQGNSPRKITLTKSQVDLARRLGISPEGYAKQLLKLEGNS